MKLAASTGGSLLICVAIFCLYTVTMPAWAKQPPSSSADVTKAVRFTQQGIPWYEGEQRKTAWLNPQLIAEFDTGSIQERTLSETYPGAIVSQQPEAHIRIWRLPAGFDAASVVDELNSSSPQGVKYSPVFHDTPSPASRMCALPGNIIVYFNEGWTENSINQWIDARDLRIVRRLAMASTVIVFQTGPGLAALELANSLRGSDAVSAAFPDWWHESVSR